MPETKRKAPAKPKKTCQVCESFDGGGDGYGQCVTSQQQARISRKTLACGCFK